MTGAFTIEYYDRRAGCIRAEDVFAAGFLNWSYNTAAGRLLTRTIISRKWVSDLYGWFCRRNFSRKLTRVFAGRMNIDKNEFPIPVEAFDNFDSFFKREIDPAARPIDRNRSTLISPADGKILVYPSVEPDRIFRVKRNLFNLRRFLGDDKLVQQFAYGSMAVIRLALSDYHHFHFPDSGVPGTTVSITGKYFAGGSYGLRHPVPFFTENCRSITLFDSDHFGRMAIIEVGAFTIGSIKQVFEPGVNVDRGDKKGYFEPGGSTVVLLMQKGRVNFHSDLVILSAKGLETRVRMGEAIGYQAGRDSASGERSRP